MKQQGAWRGATVLAAGGMLALIATATSLSAQAPPPVWLIPNGDTVTVQLSRMPADHSGFHVYRSPVGGSFERLTEEPVVPVRDPVAMLSALGEDVPRLEDVTRSATAFQMARRIQSDPVLSSVYSYVFPSVADALGLRYRDATATAGQGYRYRIVFIDAAGAETEEVFEAEIGVQQDVTPGTPGALTGDVDQDAVTVRWSYPAYAGDPQDFVVGFHVYRSDAGGAPYQRLTPSPVVRIDLATLEWVDRDVRGGGSYTYVVRAVDLTGREGSATPPLVLAPENPRPPSPPAPVAALPDEGLVRVVWRVPAELDVVGYRVERSTGLDEPYVTLNDALIEVEEPTWTDASVSGGTQYFYRVYAVDGIGRESQPSNPVAAIPFDNRPPSAPGEVSVTVQDRTLDVRWQSPEEPGVLGYHVYRGETEATLVRLTSEPIPEPAYRDGGFAGEGLVPGARYLVRVTALDSLMNESQPAEAEVLVPDDVAPGAPTGLAVENATGRDLLLRWSAAPDLDVAHYVVSRGSGPDGALVPRDTVPAEGRLLHRDVTVEPGLTYRYTVVAVDRAGNVGDAAEVVADFGDRTPPPSPGFVEARVGAAGVEVRWERVAAADLMGYRVYRALSPTGVLELVSPLVPAGAELVFTDAGGAAEHFYRIVAVDTSGNESEPTAPVRAGGGR